MTIHLHDLAWYFAGVACTLVVIYLFAWATERGRREERAALDGAVTAPMGRVEEEG